MKSALQGGRRVRRPTAAPRTATVRDRARWVVIAVPALWVAALAGFTAFGHAAPQPWYGSYGYWAVIGVSAAVVLEGAWHTRRDRGAWVLIGLGMLSWLAGDVYFEKVQVEVPTPSWADVGYLMFCPLVAAGILLLIGERLTRRPVRLLDGLGVGLAIGAITAGVVVEAVEAAPAEELATHLTNLAYPVLEAGMIAILVAGFAVIGWRANRRWALLAAALLAFWWADSVYVVQVATDTFRSPSFTDTGWMACFVLLAAASSVPNLGRGQDDPSRRRHAVVPTVFALVALTVLTTAALLRLNRVAVLFAAASLLVVLARMALALRENLVLIRATSQEASTDPLTGIGNRRALFADIEQRFDTDAPFVVALFDLNGFKAYNDMLGHPAGDALLIRFANRLSVSVGDAGRAYRLGGDEYVVVLDNPGVLSAAQAALFEQGEGYAVSASCGSVRVPAEATSVGEALDLADTRMYAAKAGGARADAGRPRH